MCWSTGLSSLFIFASRSRFHPLAKAVVPAISRGAKWSPDGTMVLSNAEDNVLRCFATADDWYRPSAGLGMVRLPCVLTYAALASMHKDEKLKPSVIC